MTTTNSGRLAGSKVYVAGHRGLAGSAILRRLQREGCKSIVTRSHRELDLTDQGAVSRFFQEERPEYVFLAAAKVGGILANNNFPAEFIEQNLSIQSNVITAAHATGVKRLLFLGSSCIYPRDCAQPIREEYLLSGPLESTNRSYAIAKIAGIEMCSAFNRQYCTKFMAAMPTNLYGPNDNYDLASSHVLPALVRKMHEAKMAHLPEVSVWGTGCVRREFLHSDDMADACVFLLSLSDELYRGIANSDSHPPLINVGCGEDLTIRELAELIREVAGYSGRLVFDISKPDGTPQKLLDVSRLKRIGWQSSIPLQEGLSRTYREFAATYSATQV